MDYNSNTTRLEQYEDEYYDYDYDYEGEEMIYEDEEVRIVYLVALPVLLTFGAIGNLLTFVVMQRGSLKSSSTCFYMAILALADTGDFYLFLHGNIGIG